MLRHVATALLCALSSVIVFESPLNPVPQPQAAISLPSPTRERALIRGHVRPLARSGPLELFSTMRSVPVAAQREPIRTAAFDTRPIAAFDPELFRGGRAGEPMSVNEICAVMEEIAGEFDLPAPLFTRLIYQESAFRNETVSRAGALGIAQFMPGTAAERGLEDPFDPLQALPASADFLRELIRRFGNFGLAAAAYNGGPRRVQDWLAGRARLPKETRDYVLRITGRKPEHWAKAARAQPHPSAFQVENCRVKPINASLEVRVRKK
jgi:soluble lytic murein transglycosylase-like protein